MTRSEAVRVHYPSPGNSIRRRSYCGIRSHVTLSTDLERVSCPECIALKLARLQELHARNVTRLRARLDALGGAS